MSLSAIEFLETLKRPLRIEQHADRRPVFAGFMRRGCSRRHRAGKLRSFYVRIVCSGRLELAHGRCIAQCVAVICVVVRRLAVATVESADAGDADGENGDCGFDGGPDCDVDDMVYLVERSVKAVIPL